MASTGSQTEVSLDEALQILSHPNRRRPLTAMAQRDTDTGEEVSVSEIKPADRALRDFKAELHHKHLPKLAQMDLIDWKHNNGTFSRGSNFGAIRPLLELLVENQGKLPEEWP